NGLAANAVVTPNTAVAANTAAKRFFIVNTPSDGIYRKRSIHVLKNYCTIQNQFDYMYIILYNKFTRGGMNMIAVNYSTLRNNLKNYCDEATDNQSTIIVTRKNEKNVVIMSLENYNQLMKTMRNTEYLAKLDRSMDQIKKGQGKRRELIEDPADE
ncbi:type II toxin-antitoxin system prevent-host-death family antitoxin, partial [Veillonella magna]|uniref:type II toxin-antitoxin system Phd/YefM family antitoxin n=2 Tax=Veillonella TaxID=29465 RepID=UPI001B7FE8D7